MLCTAIMVAWPTPPRLTNTFIGVKAWCREPRLHMSASKRAFVVIFLSLG